MVPSGGKNVEPLYLVRPPPVEPISKLTAEGVPPVVKATRSDCDTRRAVGRIAPSIHPALFVAAPIRAAPFVGLWWDGNARSRGVWTDTSGLSCQSPETRSPIGGRGVYTREDSVQCKIRAAVQCLP